MENDNNQTQENRAFKKEDAYETLGIINTWIGNMDTKVSFALALAGAIGFIIKNLGLFTANVENVTAQAGVVSSRNPLLIIVQAIPNNILSAFSTNSSILAVVFVAVVLGLCINYLGDKVKVLKAFENGWYEIELEDGETGFICGKYVDTKVENEHDYSELNNKTTTTTTSTSAKPVSTSTTQSSSNVVKTMTVSATAYAGDSMTSTGAIPKVGRTIAVDPSVIPYGTKVYIPRFGQTFIAEDCGGGIKGNTIDIYMNTQSACKSWGVRNITLEILK